MLTFIYFFFQPRFFKKSTDIFVLNKSSVIKELKKNQRKMQLKSQETVDKKTDEWFELMVLNLFDFCFSKEYLTFKLIIEIFSLLGKNEIQISKLKGVTGQIYRFESLPTDQIFLSKPAQVSNNFLGSRFIFLTSHPRLQKLQIFLRNTNLLKKY